MTKEAIKPRLVDEFQTLLARIDESEHGFCPADFRKQFFVVAGNPVLVTPPRQPVDSMDEIYEQAKACSEETMHVMQDIARKMGSSHYVIADDKTKESFNRKATNDYKGDAARVCDVKRYSIYADTPEQIRKASNLLNPSNNSDVVRKEDGFARLDEDGHIRRILGNLRASNGHVYEVQIRHSGWEKSLDRTASIYTKVRALRSELEKMERAGVKDNDKVADLQNRLDHYQYRRRTNHDREAKKWNLDQLLVDRTYNYVDGFPVIQTYDHFTGEYDAIVPDPISGKYVSDRRFLALLSDESNHAIIRNVPRETFMVRAASLVSSSGVKAYLSSVQL